MITCPRHRLLRKPRREVRKLACERTVGAEQGADVVGLGVVEVGHPPSMAKREHAT
jgi:hypothetical protein